MITHMHILIGGHLQRYGKPENGLCGVEFDILQHHNCGMTDVNYIPWYTNAHDYAVRCRAFGYNTEKRRMAKLHIVGYSFGGQTALNLCERFDSFGFRVDKLCLIDPVRRRSRMPWGWLSAFNPYAKLYIPDNVQDLLWYYQDCSWPRSHQIKLKGGTHFKAHKSNLSHTRIDNDSRVIESILKQARELHGVTGP